jgi:hypothetical protein
MGSTPTDRRHLLEQVARTIAEAHHRAPAEPSTHVAAFVELDGEEVVLGVRWFDAHPAALPWADEVQDTWWALVLCTRGRAHFLDRPDVAPEPIASTFARSRDGHELSLLRRGGELTELPGRAEGRIPDLLRTLLPVHARTPS